MRTTGGARVLATAQNADRIRLGGKGPSLGGWLTNIWGPKILRFFIDLARRGRDSKSPGR
jgi:hypothetical protein